MRGVKLEGSYMEENRRVPDSERSKNDDDDDNDV